MGQKRDQKTFVHRKFFNWEGVERRAGIIATPFTRNFFLAERKYDKDRQLAATIHYLISVHIGISVHPGIYYRN